MAIWIVVEIARNRGGSRRRERRDEGGDEVPPRPPRTSKVRIEDGDLDAHAFPARSKPVDEERRFELGLRDATPGGSVHGEA
jgi:hypothetical protein